MDSPKSDFAARRKQKTRAALRRAMLQLLIEKPFNQIQILDLTLRAKVGYATFFRHYASTNEVLDEIASDEIHELLGMTIPVFEQFDSKASVKALCQYVFDRRSLWRALLTGGAAHSVRAQFVRQALEWSHKASSKGRTPVPMDLGTICAAGSTIDALAWWLGSDGAYSADQMARFISRLIISPFIGNQ